MECGKQMLILIKPLNSYNSFLFIRFGAQCLTIASKNEDFPTREHVLQSFVTTYIRGTRIKYFVLSSLSLE